MKTSQNSVYRKLRGFEAAKTEFGRKSRSLTHAASNLGNELSEQCLWHIYFNFTGELNFWRFERLAKVCRQNGEKSFRLFRGGRKNCFALQSCSHGWGWMRRWNERNSLCAFEFNFGPAISKFSIFRFHLSRVVSLRARFKCSCSIASIVFHHRFIAHFSRRALYWYELPRRKRKKLNNQRFSQRLRSLVQLNDLINN